MLQNVNRHCGTCVRIRGFGEGGGGRDLQWAEGSSWRDSLFQQRLVEHERASCGAVLLQTEDEVPEVNSCDALTELLAGGGGRGGACS